MKNSLFATVIMFASTASVWAHELTVVKHMHEQNFITVTPNTILINKRIQERSQELEKLQAFERQGDCGVLNKVYTYWVKFKLYAALMELCERPEVAHMPKVERK